MLLARTLLLAAAVLSGLCRWLLLPAPWPDLCLAAWFLGLVLSLKAPLGGPLLAIAATTTLSAIHNGLPPSMAAVNGHPITALIIALAVPSLKVLRFGALVSAGLGLHAIISFLFFRALGGGLRVRPEVLDPTLQAILWPYYCGHYPRGGHLIGLFLNDNAMGNWSAAWLVLTLAYLKPKKPMAAVAAILLLCVAWSYSRSAYMALLCSLAYLAWSSNPRWLLLLFPLPALFWLYGNGFEQLRFFSPAHPLVIDSRWLRWVQAGQTLQSGSPLGIGPGQAGLVDSQWPKIAIELGWLGSLAYLWLITSVLRQPKKSSVAKGLKAAIVALLVASLGSDLFNSPHMAFALWGFCAALVHLPEGECPERVKSSLYQ